MFVLKNKNECFHLKMESSNKIYTNGELLGRDIEIDNLHSTKTTNMIFYRMNNRFTKILSNKMTDSYGNTILND